MTIPPATDACCAVLRILSCSIVAVGIRRYIGNLPAAFNAENVKELLTQFGPLRAFHLVRSSP